MVSRYSGIKLVPRPGKKIGHHKPCHSSLQLPSSVHKSGHWPGVRPIQEATYLEVSCRLIGQGHQGKVHVVHGACTQACIGRSIDRRNTRLPHGTNPRARNKQWLCHASEYWHHRCEAEACISATYPVRDWLGIMYLQHDIRGK